MTAPDVDTYLAGLPAEARAMMESLCLAIRAAAPGASESISYQMPTFNYCGPLVALAAWKNYCGFYTMSNAVLARFRDEMKPYEAPRTKSTLHFPFDKPAPVALIRRVVRARVRENEARAKARSAWGDRQRKPNNIQGARR